MKKLLIISFAVIAFLAGSRALAIAPSLGSEYQFHLYFNNGTLVADRDFQFKYDVLAIPYVEAPLATGFPYRGEIVSFSGQVAANFKFDPRDGNTGFNTGKITVKAPYSADAQKAIFYDPQNNAILTIPVDASSFCNDDGVCNADRGEDYQSCPRDCKASSLPAPAASTTPTPASGSSSGLAIGIIYAVIGVGLLGAMLWFLKKRNSGNPPPPSIPTFPTPPSPGNTL